MSQNELLVLDTPEGIAMYRMLAIRGGLKMEARGMRLTRGRSCLSIVRKEFGIKARDAATALVKFEEYLGQFGMTWA